MLHVESRDVIVWRINSRWWVCTGGSGGASKLACEVREVLLEEEALKQGLDLNFMECGI